MDAKTEPAPAPEQKPDTTGQYQPQYQPQPTTSAAAPQKPESTAQPQAPSPARGLRDSDPASPRQNQLKEREEDQDPRHFVATDLSCDGPIIPASERIKAIHEAYLRRRPWKRLWRFVRYRGRAGPGPRILVLGERNRNHDLGGGR